MSSPLTGRVVLVAGATGIAGRAACQQLIAADATVVAVDADPERLNALAVDFPEVDARLCDLADYAAVTGLADELPAVDGLVHLVGGWRGGSGLVGQTDEDWNFLATGLISTLRNTTRAFHDRLLTSAAGRVVIVSATAAAKPTAGNANYATAKAAAEAWLAAVADSFAKAQSARKSDPVEQTAAAVTFVVKALVTDEQRRDKPEQTFPGYTDVNELAAKIVELWSRPAAELNGARITLAS